MNRTNVELKPTVFHDTDGSIKCLNRTNVELKPMITTDDMKNNSMLESNQCGIETRAYASGSMVNGTRLNRTNVELKPQRVGRARGLAQLESNQCGIETKMEEISIGLTGPA